ncbi:MAG: SGNH/GDSL hydrolase family protein [Nitrospira sp.]
MSRGKTLTANLGLAILAVAIILGVLEAVLAITKFNAPSASRFVPGKGVTYIPHAYYRHTKEGFSEGHYNSQGFRDYERTYIKAPGVFRILILGDSYIEALQVALEDTFSAQLEKLLNSQAASTHTRFEVLALGQSGFGTADEYIRYLNFGAAYDPDLVILAFFTGNDFRNNSKYLNRENVGFYYTFDRQHNLVLDRSLIDAYERNLSFAKRLYEELKAKSHLLSLISERIYLFKRQLLEDRMAEADKDRENVGERKSRTIDSLSDLNIYRTDLLPPWKEAVEITKEIILKFRDAVEERGGRFLLLGLSNAEQVHPEVGNELKNQYDIDLDYEQPDRILEGFARESGITFLKLMPAFREYHVKTGEYLHGFGASHQGHWNQEGHRLAAELTFKFLKERNLCVLENRAS